MAKNSNYIYLVRVFIFNTLLFIFVFDLKSKTKESPVYAIYFSKENDISYFPTDATPSPSSESYLYALKSKHSGCCLPGFNNRTIQSISSLPICFPFAEGDLHLNPYKMAGYHPINGPPPESMPPGKPVNQTIETDTTPLTTGTPVTHRERLTAGTDIQTLIVKSQSSPLLLASARGNGDLIFPSGFSKLSSQGPALACPGDISTYTDINTCTAFISGALAPEFDASEVVHLTWELSGATEDASPAQGIHILESHTFNEGHTLVTYTAVGSDGSTGSCSFDVTISDNQVPRFEQVPENIVIAAASGSCAATVFWIEPRAYDNCTPTGMIRQESTARPGDEFPVGTTTVTYRARDAMGNESAPASFTVTVEDREPPAFNLPSDLTVPCGAPLPAPWSSLPQLTEAGGSATDNCTIDATSFRLLTGTTTADACPYTVIRTYEIADAAGNRTTADHQISVEGSEEPPLKSGQDLAAVTFTYTILNNVSCNGGSDGRIEVTVTATNPPYTVAWTGPVSGSAPNLNDASYTITGLVAGTYSITVTDQDNNPVTESNIVITQPAASLAVSITGQTETCFGQSTGTAEITATGGTGPYRFSIDDGFTYSAPQASPYTFSNLDDGLYPVRVQDANGCESTVSLTIIESPALNPGAHNTDPLTVCDNYNPNALTFTTPVSGGQTPYTYQWYNNGIAIPGAESDSYDPPNLGPGTYTYHCVVTDACGSSAATAGKQITVVEDPTATVSGGGPYCQNDVVTLTASVSDGTGTISYQWSSAPASTGPWSAISSATGATYAPPTNVQGTFYYMVDISMSGAACNNASSGAEEVIINTPPSFTACPASPIEIDTEAGLCNATGNYTVTATGVPAPSPTYSFSGATTGSGNGTGSGSTFNLGTTTVTVNATNSCGTQQCTFDITVIDNEAPTITCPDGVTANTDAGSCTATGVDLGTPTTNDNCGVASVTNNAPAAFPVGNTTVTWTVTDNAGITATCEQTVTITDNQAPTITCPDGVTANTDAGSCTATGVVLGTPVTADNCDVATVSNNAPAAFPVGTTTVTWTVTDINGLTATCNQTVTITDNEKPVITCPTNITVNNSTGACYATATDVNLTPATATDNCNPNPTITGVRDDGLTLTDNYPIGTTTITWTATDGTNTSSCPQTVTVIDNTPPNFTAPLPITIYTGAECGYNADPAQTGTPSGLTDNCPLGGRVPTYSDAIANGSCTGSFIITRTWRLEDAHGNITEKDQIITVTDNLKPNITAPGTRTIACHDSQDPDVNLSLGKATATDNCTDAANITISYTDAITPGTCSSRYTITRTWTATDNCGNSNSATQTINVTDTEAPVVSMPVLNVPCPSDIPEAYLTMSEFEADGGTANDVCGGTTIELLFENEISYGLENKPGYCPDYVERTYRFTDPCGNYVDVIQTINVADECGCSPCDDATEFGWVDFLDDPHGDTTFVNVTRAGKCCADDAWWAEPGAKNLRCISYNVRISYDAVGVQITMEAGATPDVKDWRVDCEEVSLEGNIICLPPGEFHLFTYCKQGGNPNDIRFTSVPGIIASDDINTRVECGTQIHTEGDFSNPRWTSISPGVRGEWDHYLDLTDPYNPLFYADENAPPVIEYEVCGDFEGYVCNPEGVNCDIVKVYVYDEIEIDLNINPDMICDDNDLPVITPDISPAGTYVLDWYSGYDATGTLLCGNCDSYQPTGDGPYSLKVTDIREDIPCGEAVFNFDIVFDLTGPTVQEPPEPLIIDCNDPLAPQQITNWLNSAHYFYTDADGTLIEGVPDNDYTGITMACGEVLTITFSAVDQCVNSNTATSTISVRDIIAPVWLTTPGDLDRTVECSDGTALAAAQALVPVATDECDDDATLTLVKTSGVFPSGGCLDGQTITNTWIATDACGNPSTVYTQTITITDTQGPEIITPASNDAALCVSGGADANPDYQVWLTNHGGAVANDLCGTVSWTNNSASQEWVIDLVNHTKTKTVTFTATDECGLHAATTASFTITDNQPPNITCPAGPVVLQAVTGECEVTEYTANLDPVYSDDCSDVVLTHSLLLPNGSTVAGTGSVDGYPFPLGTTTVTYTVTDDVGNQNTCSFDVVVEWVEFPPTIVTCPSNPASVTAPTALCEAWVEVPPPTYNDPCVAIISVVHDSPYSTETANANGTYPAGTTTVTWTITDISDNTWTCTQTVTVIDDQDPEIICPPSITEFADLGELFATGITPGDPTISDNCVITPDNLTWVMTPPAGYESNYTPEQLSGTGIFTGTGTYWLGVTTINYTLTDQHGNFATCFFTVTIEAAPDIECPPDISVNNDPGDCNATLDPGVPTLLEGAQPITWTYTITWPDATTEGPVTFVGSTSNPGPPAIGTRDFPVGVTTIAWTASNAAGTDNCTQTITVTDNEPASFDVPPAYIDCVDFLNSAVYSETNPNPISGVNPNLIKNPSPDYATFESGNTALNILNLMDNCCDLNGITINWRIDFTNTPDPLNPTGPSLSHPPVSGTGQPSAFGSDIYLHGDGVFFQTITHKITYWVQDCYGNSSGEKTQTIVITPRPEVIKQY